MMRSWLALIFVLIWQAVPAQANPVTIGGRMTDPDGKPVRGASVELVPIAGSFGWKELQLQGRIYPEAVAKAASRDDGRFQIAAPEPGMWQVMVAARGFAPQVYFLIPLLEDAELPLLQMTRSAPLRVRVLDPKGRPMAGVPVAGSNDFSGTSGYWSMPSQLVVTGADGTAEIPRPKRGPLEIEALAPGLPEATLKTESSQTTAELRLAAGCARSLRATVQENGAPPKPVAGALVTADGWTLGATGADGTLAVAAPCDRDLRIEVATREGRQTEVTFRRGPAGGPPLAVRLPAKPASVSGRVIADGSRAPVTGALVWPSEDPSAFVRTDAQGSYTVLAPADANPRIDAAAAGYLPGHEALRGVTGPTLSLTPTSTVSGVVVDEAGQPVADAVVRGFPEAQGRRFGPAAFRGGFVPARSGPQGLFRLNVSPGKPFTLSASHPDYSATRLPMAELAARQTRRNVRIVLQRGLSAFGKVVDTAGSPLSGAEVALAPTPDSDAPFAMMYVEREGPERPVVTDAQGRFSFEHLEPGRFDLQASSRGFAPTIVRGIELAAAAADPNGRRGPVNLGTVALAPGATLEGVVVDPQSRPIAGVRVSTSSMARVSFWRVGRDDDDEILTAADGSFSIPDLRAGEKVGLTAAKKGYKPARFDQLEVPGSEPLRITLTPGVRIAGRVLTEEGDPVVQANVSVNRVGGNQLAIGASMLGGFARTEEDGTFVLEGIEPGKARLSANARGFRKKESPDLDLVAGRDVEDLDLVLERGAALAGRVVGADGAPVAGARVQPIEGSGRSAMMMYRFGGSNATTDGDGNYRLEGLDEGPQSFAAQAEDFQRAVKDLEIRAGENRLDFRLDAGFDVAGRVADAGGQPVAGARVQMKEPGAPSFPFGRDEDARSAADGSFRVRGVAAGVYDVQADKEGYAPARRESLQVTGSVQGIELRLEAGGSVHGRLTGLEFSELAGARVYASTRDTTRPAMRYGSVDYQGQYRIDGLTAGEWSVSARTGSDRQAQGQVTVAQGGDAVLDLEFGEGLTLTGHIMKGGEPLPNLRVSVSSREGTGNGYGSGTSDPQGNFRIEGLKAGTYELQAIDFQTGISHHETLELTADRDILIEISTRRVSGRVVDAQDQSPLRDARVSLEAVDDKPGGGMSAGTAGIPRGSTSDSSGGFELTEVSPGAYRLRVQKDGYSPADTQVQVGADADVNDLRLALQPTQGLTLQVRSSIGSPPSGVEVALVDAAGQVKATGSYATGENGRVRFDTAPPGSWRLLTTAAGSATVSQEVQVPGPPVPVLLYPATRLAVTVPAGTEGTVTATGADGQPFRAMGWGGSVRQEWPIHEGRTVLEDLPPGSWQIRATSPDGKSWQGAVTTSPAGGSATVVLQ